MSIDEPISIWSFVILFPGEGVRSDERGKHPKEMKVSQETQVPDNRGDRRLFVEVSLTKSAWALKERM